MKSASGIEWLEWLRYVVNLVGPNHVAIGTDILIDATDGVWWRAVTGRLYREVSQGMTNETHNIDGFMRQTDFPSVAASMVKRGYDEGAIGKITGGNLARVDAQVWGAGQ